MLLLPPEAFTSGKQKEGMKNFPSTSQTAETRWNCSPVTRRPQVLHNASVKLPEVALPEKTCGEDYYQLCLPNRPPDLFSLQKKHCRLLREGD